MVGNFIFWTLSDLKISSLSKHGETMAISNRFGRDYSRFFRCSGSKTHETFVPSAHGILPNRCRKGGQW